MAKRDTFANNDAHFSLVSIRPYYDGNGRTSRLLMNYIQAITIFLWQSYKAKIKQLIFRH